MVGYLCKALTSIYSGSPQLNVYSPNIYTQWYLLQQLCPVSTSLESRNSVLKNAPRVNSLLNSHQTLKPNPKGPLQIHLSIIHETQVSRVKDILRVMLNKLSL